MNNKDFEFEKLYSLCKEFRETVDKCVEEHHKVFEGFPNGYCAQVSIWAYDYLASKGYKNIEFRNRDPFFQDRDGNHVWLHWNGYNIDLSSDQFSNESVKFPSVLIVKDEEDKTPEKRYTTGYEVTSRDYRVLMEYVPVSSMEEKQKLDLIYATLGLVFV